ncbi:hypothetical protein Tpen_1845 (plasmid) [Thermofilum pendens Hrk 5]|uniref:Uncharacterized protein n=1 Tax=Thermofilum pendens (strain DSM 2475 / Hrk 5) TaxID=368408 RepID=A1S1B0_THEPD|nr:hypothetical protein Tpen_1845 [Thermofilum pendens Hrk 5]
MPFEYAGCKVERQGNAYILVCPAGRAIVKKDEVVLYTPEGAVRVFSPDVHAIRGKISAVEPVKRGLPELLSEIGSEASAESPEELYNDIRLYEETEAAPERLWREYAETERRLRSLRSWLYE